MKVSIFRPVRPFWTPEEGPFYRMGRQTVTIPGYQTVRQWVLVTCTKEGWVHQDMKAPMIALDVMLNDQPANQPAMEQKLLEQTNFVLWTTIEA